MPGALDGIRILDLSRVLAGPSCTQLLGDLGAEIIKVERPRVGDETRTWGPPFVKDASGAETTESGYYLSTNRNKRSVTIDFARPDGAALVRRLLGRCDALVENFRSEAWASTGWPTSSSAVSSRAWSTARSPASDRPDHTRRAPATTCWSRAPAAS
jgi:crotonobetainyl-CoA:carnitine CoA-transferase CaiB-like acyl-CoA transferase